MAVLRHYSRSHFFRMVLASFASFCALAFLGGCGWSSEMLTAYQRYDSFGRRFIEQFQAGGVGQARMFIMPATLELPEAEKQFAAMHQLLPPPLADSVRPMDGNEVEEGWFSGTGRLRYRVYGTGRAAEVELWIVRSRESMYVETVRITDVTATDGEPVAAPDAPRQ